MIRFGKGTLLGALVVTVAASFGPVSMVPSRAVAEIGLTADSAGAPVVVELFTSQGCNSCPPADEFLGELADHPGILALSFHIDYWDYIGWSDPFASPQTTGRQRSYAKSLNLRYVYTPQMVIDGRSDAVGSQRNKVLKAIEKAATTRKAVEIRFVQDDGGKIVIPAGHAPEGGAAVWLAVFDRRHETPIPSGENAGRTLKNYQVVRELKRLGTWRGDRLELPIDFAAAAAQGRDGCAVIVQQAATGPILGAAALRLEDMTP